MSPHLFSGSSGSTVTLDEHLQQFGFALQANFQKTEPASYCTQKCDSEIRRLQGQLEEFLAIQEALAAELRWALEAKHVAEVALAEHVRQTRSIIDNLVASPTPRGPLDWMNDNAARDADTDSDRSLFSQPLVASSREQKMVDHRHEKGKHCDEVTKDLEMQLAKMSSQFQLLAEVYSTTALRLDQTQRDVHKLRSENLELQVSSAELFNKCQFQERRLQQVLQEQSEVSSLPSLIYGISSPLGESTYSRGTGTSPDVLPSYGVHNTDAFEDKAAHPISCGASIAGLHKATSQCMEPMPSLSQLSVSTKPIAAEGEKTSLSSAARSVGKTGKVLSERASISALVIPKPDLKSWYLPHKGNARELQQPDSPGTGSPIRSRTSSASASAAGTPFKCFYEDLTQTTDCTLLLDTNAVTLKTAAATDMGSASKVGTAVNGQVVAVLPRSISVRASGTSVATVRTNLSCQTEKKRSVSPESTESIHSLVLSPVSPLEPHRLRLSPTQDKEELPSSGSGKEGADPDEDMDVYDQGMYKTELCNKWQEGGTCPYANRCRFAHGVEELRPVLRHPRYKTELCRMVANGEKCPYGHRCHFRHAMTKEERTSLFCKFQGSV